VLAEIELFPTEEGGLDFEVKERSRSLLFVFPPLEDYPIQQGAMIERLSGEGLPGTSVDAEVQFFDDSAAIVATPGARFDLWLGRTVGRGIIKDVFPEIGRQRN
jgi:hypothetical protein